jgi:hypothetical protein
MSQLLDYSEETADRGTLALETARNAELVDSTGCIMILICLSAFFRPVIFPHPASVDIQNSALYNARRIYNVSNNVTTTSSE